MISLIFQTRHFFFFFKQTLAKTGYKNLWCLQLLEWDQESREEDVSALLPLGLKLYLILLSSMLDMKGIMLQSKLTELILPPADAVIGFGTEAG